MRRPDGGCHGDRIGIVGIVQQGEIAPARQGDFQGTTPAGLGIDGGQRVGHGMGIQARGRGGGKDRRDIPGPMVPGRPDMETGADAQHIDQAGRAVQSGLEVLDPDRGLL